MNKVLSQAIKKAVSEFTPLNQETNKEKRPDLFSLNNNTERKKYENQSKINRKLYKGKER